MTLQELLKNQGLSDEQIASVTKAMTENKIYTTALENADERYAKLKGQKEDAEKQLETANTTITDLKKSGGDAEKLKSKIGEYETEIGKLQAESAINVKTFALKEQLSKAGVNDPDYLIYKHGGVEKFNYDSEGKPIGVEDSIKPYKEDKTLTHLFKVDKPPYNPAGGDGVPEENPWKTGNLTMMSKIYNENPELARKLASAAGKTID